MFPGMPTREDRELERLYSQARQYDLLSREQEREIDERKWGAVRSLLELLVEGHFSRHYLERWAGSCTDPLPDIARFKSREHQLLLRRELGEYLPGGSKAEKMVALAGQFAGEAAADDLLAGLLELSLPASLVVGMAEAVSLRGNDQRGSQVAAALRAWEPFWPRRCAAVLPAPGPAMVKSLAAQIKRYTAARDLLIKHNLRLVFTIAGRHRNKGAAFLDLVQEGNLGLLRAAEKFQFERGYRFSTYAFNWITQGVKRYLAESAGAIRFPSHIQEQLGRVYGERGRRLARSGIAPGDRELADALDLPTARVRELLQLRNLGESLEAPRFDDKPDATLLDTIPGGPFADPGDEAERTSLNHRLLSEIRRLDQAEQQVLIQRWGLLQYPPLTRAEIADQMSVSREWVRQLEQSALEKLGRSETIHAVYRAQYRDAERKEG